MRNKFAGMWLATVLLGGCSQRHATEVQSGKHPPILSAAFLGAPKTQASGETRILIGRGTDYTPISEDPEVLFKRLEGSMADRRATAWKVVEAILQPQTIQVNGKTYEVPLWHTWYDGFSGANPEAGQKIDLYFDNLEKCHVDPGCKKSNDDIIRETMAAQNGQDKKDLARNLTNANFTQTLRQFQNTSNSAEPDLGHGFTLFSPSFVEHVLAEAQGIEGCTSNTVPWNQAPPSSSQFSTCITEFPRSAVMIKTSWSKLEGAATAPQTDSNSIAAMIQGGTWPVLKGSAGDPSKMYTIETREGQKFALRSLHISTKDTREWIWISLWWSPDPNSDFGSDRPASITRFNGGVWANYKMCVTTSFDEGDPTPWKAFEASQPSLAAALKSVYQAIGKQADPKPYDHVTSWCSNANIERQPNNGKTNCIGCHQYSMSWDVRRKSLTEFDQTLDPSVAEQTEYPQFGRSRRRSTFQADFSWSFLYEDLANVIKSARENHHYEWPKTLASANSNIHHK